MADQPGRIIDQTTTVDKMSQCSVYDVTMAELEAGLAQVDRGAIRTAATSWYSAASRLGELANRLLSEAGQPLADAWIAPSSALSQQQLQLAQATARSLANECMQMAHAMDYTAKVADWYDANKPRQSTMQTVAVAGATAVGGFGGGMLADKMVDDQLNKAASEHLNNFMQRYRQVLTDALPAQVQEHLANSRTRQDDGPVDDGRGGGGGSTTGPKIPNGGSLGGPSAGGLGGPQSLQAGTLPGGTGSGVPGLGSPSGGAGLGSGLGSGAGSVAGGGIDPYAASTQLAGGGPAGGIGGPLASGLGPVSGGGLPGIGDGLAGPGGLGGSGLGPGGLGAGGLGGGLGRGGLAGGPGGGIGGVGGLGREEGALGGARGAGAGAAGQGRAGMNPMMGGHGGGDEEERERSTWLSEDDDVWGGNGPAAPPLITS